MTATTFHAPTAANFTSRSAESVTLPVIARVPMRTVKRETVGNLDSTQRVLRVDQSHANDKAETFETVSGQAPPQQEDPQLELASDWLPEHAQDLIDRLRQWSLELDERELQLQQRAGELEASARQLRMLRSSSLTGPKNDAPSFRAVSHQA